MMNPQTDYRVDEQMTSRIQTVCKSALTWSHQREYAGWDPYDGLNSPYLSRFCSNWLSRLIGIHLVEKTPVNLRPLLAVPKERNPKGVALFAMSYLHLFDVTGNQLYLDRAESLLNWLTENQAPEFDGAWGYNFDWQNGRKFFLPAFEPSIVVSVFCGRAFLDHYELTGDQSSLAVAKETVQFVQSEINSESVDGQTVYTYTPHDSFVVVNANALAAKFFARVADQTGNTVLFDHARELMLFVANAQVETGAWYYAVPADESHLAHDNFHTGFVLESLAGYLSIEQDPTIKQAYDRGLEFFKQNLFEPDGAPRFEHDQSYPHDAHAAGQAIRTFALDGAPSCLKQATDVSEWAIDSLYEDGYFHRKKSYIDDTTPYIRWSQAWMCYGLSTYLAR